MSVFSTIILAALILGQADTMPAGERNEDKAAAGARLEYMKRSATVYKAILDDKSRTELKLIEEPVLRWTNPVSNVPDGGLFLWVGPQGRPEFAAQVFIAAGTKDLWLHEFQSLSQGKFSVQRDGTSVWRPQTAGIEIKDVADSPPPAESAVQRLTQMRTLAQNFQAADDFEGKSRWELRLLPKPLQRYGKAGSEILDGALFVFAHGTDPEVFLMLEARRVDGQYRWQYALAPMTAYALKVTLHGKEVWNAPHRNGPFQPDAPFYILKYVP